MMQAERKNKIKKILFIILCMLFVVLVFMAGLSLWRVNNIKKEQRAQVYRDYDEFRGLFNQAAVSYQSKKTEDAGYFFMQALQCSTQIRKTAKKCKTDGENNDLEDIMGQIYLAVHFSEGKWSEYSTDTEYLLNLANLWFAESNHEDPFQIYFLDFPPIY